MTSIPGKLSLICRIHSSVTSAVELDAAIRTDNVGPSLGMENSYQSLGAVARPNSVNAEKKDSIVVYMGSTDPNTKVDIVFLQNYGQPGDYISKVTTISPGVTEIEIPTIINEDVEISFSAKPAVALIIL